MSSWYGKSYPAGTRVQRRTGYIYVKTDEGLIAEGRRVYELTHGELEPGYRVFHMDGDRTNNSIRNLSAVKFNTTKFTMLKESKVLWMPKVGRKDLTNEVLALAKKRLVEGVRKTAKGAEYGHESLG